MARASADASDGKASWLAALLVLAVFLTFLPALGSDFLNYDDDIYVTDNLHVTHGVGLSGIAWALGSTSASNWHPLTWISHMLDCQLFGLQPWGHHLTSVLLHAINTLLVFVLFRRLSGALWRPLAAAALFGLHPLHVQSVAWVSERKDVLSACFFLLSLLAYARHAQGDSRLTCRPSAGYGLALLWFALGLLSKPMLVTLPAVLLLVDYWPLGRWGIVPARRLLVEKAPFVLLSAGSSVITFLVQRAGGGMAGLGQLSLGDRVTNALVSYVRYLGKFSWPAELAVLYPHRGGWPAGKVMASLLLLGTVSAATVILRRKRPYLLAGWLWFLGMLVPVIGLIQVGQQSMADRYMYLPMLGLLFACVWGLAEVVKKRRLLTRGLAVATAVVVLVCAGATRAELGHWKDSEALFRRDIAVTGGSATAEYKLGLALNEKGKLDEAYLHLERSLALAPGSYQALAALGVVCKRRGEMDRAVAWLEAAIAKNPGDADSHYQLGSALDGKGRHAEAIAQYEKALRLAPGMADAHLGIGVALARQGKLDMAMKHFERALVIDPANASASYNLGLGYAARGSWDEAATAFHEALSLAPHNADAHNNLGLVLLTQGKRAEAVREFEAALRIDPRHGRARDNLAAALGQRN